MNEVQKAVDRLRKDVALAQKAEAIHYYGTDKNGFVSDVNMVCDAVEKMQKALEFFADTQNYVHLTGMSVTDKQPRAMRDGRLIAKHALEKN